MRKLIDPGLERGVADALAFEGDGGAVWEVPRRALKVLGDIHNYGWTAAGSDGAEGGALPLASVTTI